jgi:hypothetical protein
MIMGLQPTGTVMDYLEGHHRIRIRGAPLLEEAATRQ